MRWKSKKSDVTNGGYTQEMLQSLFEKVKNHFIKNNVIRSRLSRLFFINMKAILISISKG